MHVKAIKYELDFATLGGGLQKLYRGFLQVSKRYWLILESRRTFCCTHYLHLGTTLALMDQFQYFPRQSFPGKLKKIPTFVSVFCHQGAQYYGATMGSLSLTQSSSQSSPALCSTLNLRWSELMCVRNSPSPPPTPSTEHASPQHHHHQHHESHSHSRRV